MDEKCSVCGNDASKTDRNMVGYLCCQRCGVPLCYNCAIYGFDVVPRCETCHDWHIAMCDKECKGNKKEEFHCQICEYNL